VLAVERFVQQLRAPVTLAGEQYSACVQIVIRGGRRLLSTQFD